MSRTLHEHLNHLLNNAIHLLSIYKEDLSQEWQRILYFLQQNEKPVHVFALVKKCLLRHFTFVKIGSVNVDDVIQAIQTEWMETFQRCPEPELVIFHLNLLENAAHKVLKKRIAYSSKLHPSVHYLFSKISEAMLYLYRQEIQIDDVCERLLSNPNLPTQWVARIEEKKEGFSIKKIIGVHPYKNIFDENTMFCSWDEIVSALGSSHLPVPWKNELLLFGVEDKEVAERLAVSVHLFRAFQEEEEKTFRRWQESRWKDAVILFNEWIIRSQNFQEAMENICFGFGYFLPFERCALFRLSDMESKIIGLYGYRLNNEEIQAITDEIANIPIVNESIGKLKSQHHDMKHFQPIYIPFANKEFPENYIKKFGIVSLVIVPVYVPTEGKIIGGIVLDQGAGKHFAVDRSLFPALMKFGQSAGELLLRFIEAPVQKQSLGGNAGSFSLREIEIMKLLADGASTAEAASQLYLSEFTVRDYISSLMKKLHAKNRTELVAKAMRLGIIQ
ncbi:LuxR C-terminal-related transcriptional regulator [Anoxybacillus sp. J5B_2022]|uniref:LuxR C-terminal-related transcriptional regulator n=1 Tax=Anoxybacillus sp. J5B_2022 TaxID=3003246 RepID=UPI0022866570|nr:LuxR C-terminal-related transcriptional regulator [Anoxybacillus sp. J5B_2022]MCZ0754566.1 LuxR C-terminal-related transcriptional regulator [Anoxybacillus sp. J5B_2022]